MDALIHIQEKVPRDLEYIGKDKLSLGEDYIRGRNRSTCHT